MRWLTRDRFIRSFGVPAFICLVTLSTLVMGTQTANALTVAPTPVDIGTKLASAGSKWVVREEAAAAGSTLCGPGAPVCLAVTSVAAVGLLAYDTRDLWYPVLEGALGASSTTSTLATPTFYDDTQCATLNGTQMTVAGLDLRAQVGTCSNPYTKFQVIIRCKLANGQPFVWNQAYGGWTGVGGGLYGPGNASAQITSSTYCDEGGVITDASVRFTSWGGPTGVDGVGRTLTLTSPYSAENSTQITKVECLNTRTGERRSFSNEEIGQVGRFVVPSCRTHFGDGWVPRKLAVSTGPDPLIQKAPTVVEDTTDWAGEYADCLDGVGNPMCDVQVWVGNQPCTRGGACSNWQTQAQANPENVQCKYGSHVVPIADCQALQHQLEPNSTTQTVTTTNPNGSPNTQPNPNPDPDPDPDPDPSPSPSSSTGANPFPSSGPNPGTGTAPGGTGPSAQPDPATSDTSSCWGTGWSFNPVSWVVIPVKCSLTWAFSPPPGYFNAKVTDVKTQMSATTPGQWLTAIQVLVTVPSGGSCAGIPVSYDLGPMDVDMSIGAACSGAMATTAGVVRIGLSALVCVGGAFACFRTLGSAFGWSPAVGKGTADA